MQWQSVSNRKQPHLGGGGRGRMAEGRAAANSELGEAISLSKKMQELPNDSKGQSEGEGRACQFPWRNQTPDTFKQTHLPLEVQEMRGAQIWRTTWPTSRRRRGLLPWSTLLSWIDLHCFLFYPLSFLLKAARDSIKTYHITEQQIYIYFSL